MDRKRAIDDLKVIKEFFEQHSEASPVCLEYAITELSKKEQPPEGMAQPEPKFGEWIPCSEKLPEEYEEVLVLEPHTAMYVAMMVGKSESGVPVWIGSYGNEDFMDYFGNVKAWMPRPDLYMEGDSND